MDLIENIYDEEWVLSHTGAAFLPQRNILLISDLHIGKLNHFRKAGIGLPSVGEGINFDKISKLLLTYKPTKVLFLGDLFHSEESKIWKVFGHFLTQNERVEFILIKGNHDAYVGDQFSDFTNFTIKEELIIGSYIFTHEPLIFEKIPMNKINICGHIHPAVKLKGKGRQTLVIRCFVFGTKQLIMPAFGEFTGNYVINPKKNDQLYGITNNEIFSLN